MSIPWEMDLDVRAAGNRTESFESDNSGISYYWDSMLAPDVRPPPQPLLTFPPNCELPPSADIIATPAPRPPLTPPVEPSNPYGSREIQLIDLLGDEIPPTPRREVTQPRRNVVSFSSPVATTIAEESNSSFQESTRTTAADRTNPFHPCLFTGRPEHRYENVPLAPPAAQPPPLPSKLSSFQVPGAPDRVPLPRMLPATPLTHPPPTSLTKYIPVFTGQFDEDPREFLTSLHELIQDRDLAASAVLRALPSVLAGTALTWFRLESPAWTEYYDFVKVFCKTFAIKYPAHVIRQEATARTQGPQERPLDFIMKIRRILKRMDPPMELGKQLNLAYHNLLPLYRQKIAREELSSFQDLINECHRVDTRKLADRSKHLPPRLPSASLFPTETYNPLTSPRNPAAPIEAELTLVQEKNPPSPSPLVPRPPTNPLPRHPPSPNLPKAPATNPQKPLAPVLLLPCQKPLPTTINPSLEAQPQEIWISRR
ncbi:proteoglycan 4-like [Prorops nasuta]|uniref:proteoglycan 4-like n=1 Tax=Prorops nasuta TaxID=863751 RepID=UPI0034CE2D47